MSKISIEQSVSLADVKPSSFDNKYKSLFSGEKTSNENQDVNNLINAEFILVDSLTEVTAIEKGFTQVISEDSTKTELQQAGPSTSAEANSEPIVSKRLLSTGTKYSIPVNVALPQLSYDLEQRIEKEGITAKNRRYFIAYWGSLLWNMTNGNPKPRDYRNLTESIIKAYPTLKSGDDGCSLVQLQLSIWIRNHRRYNKPKSGIQAPIGKRYGRAKLPVENAELVPTNTIQENETDVEYMLKELEKKFVKGVNVSHVRNLLKMTIKDRRPWIENDANRIVDVIKKYPAFGDGGMILDFTEFPS